MDVTLKGLDSIKAQQQRLLDMKAQERSEREKAIRRIADKGQEQLDHYAQQTSEINKQDAPGNGISPATIPFSKDTRVVRDKITGAKRSSFRIVVGGMWMLLRISQGSNYHSEAYYALVSFGALGLIERTELVIKGRGWKNLKRVPINIQNLGQWARRLDKGQQLYRHAAFIEDARVLEQLILNPVLRETNPLLRDAYKEIVRKLGFK